MKLSVIIPVYRVEQTLNRCVESVLCQYDDMEVILVDDGSPDRCPALCDEWRGKDPRIVVIHKKNGGLSDARNAGISKARGEYITFVDSDDTLQSDTLAPVLQYAIDNGCDMVEYPIHVNIGASNDYVIAFEKKTQQFSCIADIRDYWSTNNQQNHCYAPNKIFSKHMFDDVRFPVGRAYEDIWILPELLLCAKKVGTCDCGQYLYYYNEQGICRSEKNEAQRLEALVHVFNMLEMCVDDAASAPMLMDILNAQATVYQHSRIINRDAIALLRHVPLAYGRGKKEKIKIIMLRMLLLVKSNK